MRYDTIHALGNEDIITPNIDKLVREGVSFTQTTTPSPVCMPARCSLHSGQWTTTHKCYSNHHRGIKVEENLPSILKKSGYKTALIGKNHSFLEASDMDYFNEYPSYNNPKAAKERYNWLKNIKEPKEARLCFEPAAGGIEGDSDYAKTDDAIKFVENCEDSPFFLWLSYLHPHTPYHVPEPYFSMYKDDVLGKPLVEENLNQKPFRQKFHKMNNDAIMPFNHETILHMRKVYCGQVSFLDSEIGRFLEGLSKKGIEENTFIIFMSDHGDYMGEHSMITKSPSLYDCLVRTPLILKWPKNIKENQQSEELASHIDIMPTILEAAKCDCPKAVQGESLLPYAKGEKQNLRDFVFSEYGTPGKPYSEKRAWEEGIKPGDFLNPFGDPIPWEGNPVSLSGRIRMIKNKEWKLVEEEGGTNELYNLKNDPAELKNLYEHPKYKSTAQNLLKKLSQWKATLPGIEEDNK